MTNEKPKPLFPSEVPKITIPVLSIEEPYDRPMPTPVPVVLPLRTVKGGTAYVAELMRTLPLKVVASILVSEEETRKYELSIKSDYLAVVAPIFYGEGDASIELEYSKLLEWIKEVNLSLDTSIDVVVYSMFGMKYDGYSRGDILAMHGIKYDGYSKSSLGA